MADKPQATPQASLTVLDGVAVMVGIVVGIGIFKTPSLVAANVDSGMTFMAVWLLGGLVTLIGALCYAELAAAHPSAGGEYHFLQRAYGRIPATLFAWARGTVIQTGAIALVAFVFGDYAAQLVPLGPNGPAIYAALTVIVFSALNLVGTLQSANAQRIFTIVTLGAMLVVIVAGLLYVGNSQAAAAPASASGTSGGAVGLAMVLVLLTYGGWNEVAYLSGEMRDVRRNMMRVMVFGTLVLVALYGAMAFAYLHALGLERLRAAEAPAADLMRLAAGQTGAVVLALVVCCAAISTLNGTIFTGARVYFALGRDIPALGKLGIWSSKGDNPVNAILLQGAIAFGLVLFGATTRDGFQAMVEYTAPVFWFFMMLVGLSLFVLRWREPERELPFRVPLYPVTPALFVLTCLYLLYSSLMYTGLGALVGVVVLLAGVPLLFLADARRRSVPAE
ncbi:MAG TPA: amino acid permease [Xanthobacteraceae bacterium]|nr:amino acid permease [Xanthobacteraceae bacterium]